MTRTWMGPATVPVVNVSGSRVLLPVAMTVLEVAARAVTVGGGGIVGWVAPGEIVVVAAAEFGGYFVGAGGGPDAREFVRGDGHANARAALRHAVAPVVALS